MEVLVATWTKPSDFQRFAVVVVMAVKSPISSAANLACRGANHSTCTQRLSNQTVRPNNLFRQPTKQFAGVSVCPFAIAPSPPLGGLDLTRLAIWPDIVASDLPCELRNRLVEAAPIAGLSIH